MTKKASSLNLLLIAVIAAATSGCGMLWGDDGVFRNRTADYQKADVIAPLTLPEGADTHNLGDLYPVPKAESTEYEDSSIVYDVPRPAPIASNIVQESVKIQRLGAQNWILMNVAPGEVWPRLRSFLNVNGLAVSNADIGLGIIETGWIQFKDDLKTHDRYRIQVDQGVQPETSEIHILHMNIADDAKRVNDLPWPTTSNNPEREKWLLDELAATLASDATEGGTSLLAQNIGGATKAGITTLRGEPVLSLRLDRTRALGTLAHALKQDGFTPFESDSDLGIFYVNYTKPEEEGGFFSRFKSKKPLVVTSPYTLVQLIDALPVGDILEISEPSDRAAEKNLPKAPGYLLLISGVDGDLKVRLRDPYGKRVDPRVARDLLIVLRKNLI